MTIDRENKVYVPTKSDITISCRNHKHREWLVLIGIFNFEGGDIQFNREELYSQAKEVLKEQ